MTATLFPGDEFLFSMTQVIDFRQGSTTYTKSEDQYASAFYGKENYETKRKQKTIPLHTIFSGVPSSL